MRNTITLLMIMLVVGITNISQAQQTRKQVVRFARGSSGASYQNAVIRGETMTYVLGARKGQTMIVKVWAQEKNAVFQIRHKNTKRYLKGAKPGEDTRSWTGKLPLNGDYEIIVGGTRGNATFNISFTIM